MFSQARTIRNNGHYIIQVLPRVSVVESLPRRLLRTALLLISRVEIIYAENAMDEYWTSTCQKGVYLRDHRRELSHVFIPRVVWEVTDQPVERIGIVAMIHRLFADGTTDTKAVSWFNHPDEGDPDKPWTGYTRGSYMSASAKTPSLGRSMNYRIKPATSTTTSRIASTTNLG